MRGFFEKEGHIFKTWKKRYFVLNAEVLSYYTDENMSKLKGSYTIRADSSCNKISDKGNKKNCMALQAVGSNDSDMLILSAPTEQSQKELMNAINEVIETRIRMIEDDACPPPIA